MKLQEQTGLPEPLA